ncbi:MAG: hypothetical protein Q4C36_01390 [Coriobacteriia bacterium]|nr:hypothetical protein [Coriobacteriia bacterium]
MQVLTRNDVGARSWMAFLAAAMSICLAFAMLGFTSGAAFAAPDKSESTASEESSSSALEDPDATAEELLAATEGENLADQISQGMPLGDDLLFGAGNLVSSGDTVKANLFASAGTVDLKNTTIGADAFISGETINISDMAAKNNIFVAGNNITMSGTTCKTLMAAGNNLDLAADATDVYAAGRTVFLKGTFEGDVYISAESVVIDPYIVVKGALSVHAASEPTIASTAKITDYEFVQEDMSGFDISQGFANIGSEAWLKNLLMTLLSLLLIGIVMLLFLRTEVVDASGLLVRNRPVAILVTGLLSLILLPVLALGFFLSMVGWPIGVALVAIYTCITVLCVAYTAISLGRAAFIRINKWISSIIFLIIFALLMSLPVVDFIVSVLCLVYTVGAMVQGWWVWRRGKELDGPNGPVDAADFTVPRGSHYADNPMPESRPLVPSNIQQTTGSVPPYEAQ